MKRLSITLLLGLILLNTTGYYLFYCVDLAAIRHEMREMIRDTDHEEALSFTFPLQKGVPEAQGLVFTDVDEFMYQGKMYDIISESKDNGQITYKCYTDSDETELTADLSRNIETDQGLPSQKNKDHISLKDYLKDYTDHIYQLSFAQPATCMVAISQDGRSASHLNAIKTVLSPPPEILSI